MNIPENIIKETESRLKIDVKDAKKLLNFVKPEEFEPEFVNRRKKMIVKSAAESPIDAFERYIGNNDLLPVNFFLIGYNRSRSVGRINLVNPDTGKQELATGFLITNDLIITNHHVFPEKRFAEKAKLEMDYEFDLNGEEKERIIFNVMPSKFFYNSKALDFAVVGISESDVESKHEIKEFGCLSLDPEIGKAGWGEFVSIIQHPDGQLKQIAIRENRIIDKENPNFIVYEADTSRGSSGAVVCNDQWQVIAIHHSGVAKKDKNGNYIDANGEVIPEANGKIDASRVVWIANEGVRVSAIIKDLKNNAGDDKYIKQLLLSKPLSPKESFKKESTTSTNSINKTMDNNTVKITVPLNITVSLGSAEQAAFVPSGTEELQEKIEIDTNYSNRLGYREDFLGTKVALPRLSTKLLKKVARFKEEPDEYVLKYFRHSVVHSAERKMPFFSAVNVDGKKDQKYKREKGDAWIQDIRIDDDDQLNNKFYKNSGFDRGHMVRREDAEWGNTVDDAKKGSDDTFHYTNCCPQVAALNQAKKKGVWGQLEVFILENGARDDEHEMKINVFNGPVFSNSDPVFKGVQIPMKYWKIVTWKTKNKKLAATAFLLSQESLVSDIDFEEFSFSEEFKDYQYKISKLEKEIGISFNGLSKFDTFTKKNIDFEKLDSLEKIMI